MRQILITVAAFAFALTFAIASGGCTKRIVGHKGIYSPQQLPPETQTPFLDALGNTLEPESSRKR